MKKAWKDGTRFVQLEPHELLARICAMVLPLWFDMVRFYEVLAPNAKVRSFLPAPMDMCVRATRKVEGANVGGDEAKKRAG